MALYTIGDTHLSLGSNKPMDVFGGGWAGYIDKLKEGFQIVSQEDTVVICGDVSWGMSLEEAKEDFAFLDALPGGRKLLLKGNHDYWWTTASKLFSRRTAFIPWIFFTITVMFMGRPPCAAPGDGSMRRTGGSTAPRFSIES